MSRKTHPVKEPKLDPRTVGELNRAWRRSIAVLTRLDALEVEAEVTGRRLAKLEQNAEEEP